MSALKRHTKIICTIGPASSPPDVLHALIREGMDCARLNFSHAEYENFSRIVKDVREISKESNKFIAILGDLCGPRLRIGSLKEPVEVEEGGILYLVPSEKAEEGKLPAHPDILFKCVSEGQRILLGGGEVEGVVEGKEKELLKVRITRGGRIRSNMAINVPEVDLPLPSLTERDKGDLRWAVEHDLDWIAVSFVQSEEGIFEVREELRRLGRLDIPVMAKIECRSALENIAGIVEASDGVMVARGDLGLETPLWEVPLWQKKIIKRCNDLGKPVVTATQMLESMVRSPLPTRAEVSDVANAVLDGTDAVMLSEETAVGEYPVEAVKAMAATIKEAEEGYPYEDSLQRWRGAEEGDPVDAVSQATCELAERSKAEAILVPTKSGFTARMVSKRRPRVGVVAVTPEERVARRLAISWGVWPLLLKRVRNVDELIYFSAGVALRAGMLNPGDLAVITGGTPPWVTGNTNVIKLHRLGRALVEGNGVGDGFFVGRVTYDPKEAKGKVLALHDPSEIWGEKPGCVILEVKGGLPGGMGGVVEARNAREKLKEDLLVLVDCKRGVVYEAEERLRKDEG